MNRILCTVLLLVATSAFAQDRSNEQDQVWNLEKSYWDYVKANDLEKYRALWHEDFIGWPFFSPSPVHKDHITDWITTNTSKGIFLKSYHIEQLALQITRDIAIVHYRIKADWAGGGPSDSKTETTRITHTWLRRDATWQIIGGMSGPVNADGK